MQREFNERYYRKKKIPGSKAEVEVKKYNIFIVRTEDPAWASYLNVPHSKPLFV